MNEVIRELATGRIRGETVANGAVERFLGIPYAGDVDGAGRFLPAPPLTPWAGIRDATSLGPAAPQPAMVFGTGERADTMIRLIAEARCTEPQGENCLVLNVWAPHTASASPRPVMFSIHGGAHTICSGGLPVFDGASLAAKHDAIVVSPNHRLGVLGYLYLDEVLGDAYAGSGNVGTLDLIGALTWVRDNVATLGGDPGNVTIFGESGGGSKVSTLMAVPAASGLFHRAVVQSGPTLRAIRPHIATATAAALVDDLGLGNSARSLLDVPVDALISAQLRVLGGPIGGGLSGGRTIGPVIDDAVLWRHPFEPDAPATSASVPLLIGTTKDEMTMFTYPNEALDELGDDGAVAAIALLVGDAARPLYETYCATRPAATPSQRLAAILTDRFRVHSIRLAERKAAAGGAPVWMYRFDYETDVAGGALGAPHGIDIAMTFGNPDASALSGTGPDRYAVAARTSAMWATFARTGNPQTSDIPAWPPYDAPRRATMLIDSDCHVVEDPDATERCAWDGIATSM